jgi:hypothetical protein
VFLSKALTSAATTASLIFEPDDHKGSARAKEIDKQTAIFAKTKSYDYSIQHTLAIIAQNVQTLQGRV